MLTTIIGWIVVGSVCGWFAGFVMRCDTQERILLNILVGILGAVAAGAILGRHDIAYGFSIEAFLWSLLGAIGVLVLFNVVAKSRFANRLSK